MEQLFNDLMALVVEGDYTKFFYKDFVTPMGMSVRIFTYNYAAYTDWLNPGALECRGVMFELDEDKQPVKILARPMEKFFNLGECPFTMDLDLNELDYGMLKADGSLISTFDDCGTLRAKSKGSLYSEQAFAAQGVLFDVDHKDLYDRALELAQNGYTCNFEYVAPDNRIVVAYPVRELVLLNVRENETGEYVPIRELEHDPVLRKYLVSAFARSEDNETPEQMIEDLRAMTGIEGAVFVMNSGLRFKVKTEWYSTLHRTKDTLKNNEALFNVVVAAGSDDLKSLFDDEWSRTKIEKFETVFFNYLKEAIAVLNEFKTVNSHLERKDFAILSQVDLKAKNKLELFGISMLLWQGRLDQESLVDEINKVFLKNCLKFVPEEYKTVKVQDD